MIREYSTYSLNRLGRQGRHEDKDDQRTISITDDWVPRSETLQMRKYLQDHKESLFCTSGEVCVRTLDASAPNAFGEDIISFSNSWEFVRHIKEQRTYSLRIISIFAQNSVSPLGLDLQATRELIQTYELKHSLFDFIAAFGMPPKHTEAGAGRLKLHEIGTDSFELQYLLQFPEATIGNSYTFRQMGVYHRQNSTSALWLFFHAKKRSTFQENMEHNFRSGHFKDSDDWQKIHILIVATCIDNWRWYLRNVGDNVEKMADAILAFEFSRNIEYGNIVDLLIRMQGIRDRIGPAIVRITTTMKIVTSFRTLCERRKLKEKRQKTESDKFDVEIEKILVSLEGYFEGSILLEKRVEGLLSSLNRALDWKNRATSAHTNDTMLEITKDAVEDSATVKIVTLVSLIFLPASFVATLLGSNLFTFESQPGSGFQVSRQFWVFFIISIPLTMITVGSWIWVSRRRRRARRYDRRGVDP